MLKHTHKHSLVCVKNALIHTDIIFFTSFVSFSSPVCWATVRPLSSADVCAQRRVPDYRHLLVLLRQSLEQEGGFYRWPPQSPNVSVGENCVCVCVCERPSVCAC